MQGEWVEVNRGWFKQTGSTAHIGVERTCAKHEVHKIYMAITEGMVIQMVLITLT